jgi:hypothetical protein
MQDFCKASDHFQTLEKGYCGRGEDFHMEQNLVLIVVSAYDLSGKQSESWLSEEEVANRCSSEPCYQCRWAATLEWELYLHLPNFPRGHTAYNCFPGESSCEQDCVQSEPVAMSETTIDPAVPCAWIPKNLVLCSGLREDRNGVGVPSCREKTARDGSDTRSILKLWNYCTFFKLHHV